jgi:CHAT domain-containing protein
MRKILQNILSYSLFALVLYFILSLIHLSWYIANPEGFFGFSYFIEVVRVVFLVLLIIVIIVIGIGVFLSSLKSILKGESSIKNLLTALGVFVAIIIMTIFNSLWYSGLSYLFASELSEKYSLIHKTEDYLKDGKIDEALQLADQSYEKEQNRDVGWFFILTKLYSLTDYDKKEKLLAKYSATISYGFVLNKTVTSTQTGEEKFNEAISIANENLLKEEKNELLIFPTLSLAEINLRSENFKLADEYFNVLLDLQQVGKTKDVLYLINTYMLFATKASAIGDFSKSIKIQEEVLKLYEESELSKNSKNYLYILLAVSSGKLYNKNFTSAAELLVKAQPIAEDKNDTSIYLNYLSIKGSYCLISALHKQGDERLIDKSFWDKIMGSSNANLSLELRLFNQAEDCFKELLKSSEDIAGTNSVLYLNAITTLANFYYLTSQFNKAKVNFDKALTLIKSSGSSNKTLYNEIYLKSLLNKSRLTDVKINELVEVENFVFNKIRLNFSVLAEEEKEIYAMRMQKFINLVNKFYVIEDSEKSRERLYNNIISVKSLALSSNKVIREYIKKADSELKARYIKLLKEKKEFKMKSFGFKNLQEENELRNKEKELLQQVYDDPHFKKYLPKLIDWKDIRKALNPNEVAIEFINLNQSEGAVKNSQYYALIVGKNYTSPKLIKLFKERDLSDLINVRGDTKNRVNTIYSKNHTKLYNLIFKPIDQFLENDTRVYISKSGLLHNISFSALFKDKSWDVYILQITKDITELTQLNNTNSAAFFGGIDYGSDSINYSRNTKLNKTLKSQYKNLNYTLSEVTNISKLFLKDNSFITKIYTNYKASESSFRELSSSETDIIHIATHGYYNKSNEFNSFTYNGLENGQFESSPLLRSGLLFAGANNSSFNTKNNDGIMTSLEISEMDLSKVDLVVLSACETGLGDVLGSEGVFGLQRAFKLAGAKSLIVSLWQVPDKQTAELMLKFYDYYLSGSSKTEALKKAQNDIKKSYSNPYFWAGFELIQ